MSALLQYYFDTTLFNLGFSVLISAYGGPLWGAISFATFGTLIGFLVFAYFKNNEYYFYHNLGYTKKALMVKVWSINLSIAILLIALLVIVLSLI